ILSTPPSGRLYKALVEGKLASSVFAGADGRHDPCVFDAQAEVSKDKLLDGAMSAMLKTIDDLASGGVTDEEVERAKRSCLNARRQQAVNTSSLAVGLINWV